MCRSPDTIGRTNGIYQQTVIDTYSKLGFAKLYTRKTPLTAADILYDRVIPLFDEHDTHERKFGVSPPPPWQGSTRYTKARRCRLIILPRRGADVIHRGEQRECLPCRQR